MGEWAREGRRRRGGSERGTRGCMVLWKVGIVWNFFVIRSRSEIPCDGEIFE